MRLISTLLATAAMFVASSASALVITLGDGSASGGVTVAPGGLVTIELRISDDGTQEINGVGASVYGYEPGLTFVSGRAVRFFLTDTDGLRFANSAGTGNTIGGLFSQRVLAQLYRRVR